MKYLSRLFSSSHAHRARAPLAALSFVGAMLAAESQALAATFPVDANWKPITQGGQGLGDPGNDGSTNAREIVGDAANPALYIASDGTSFFFRVRLDSDPQSTPGNLGPFGWGILIDTDGNYGKYDFSLMVSGKNNEENIQFWRNDAPIVGGDPSDSADVLLNAYPNVFSGAGLNVRVVPATSTFNSSPDVFLDIAIPLADFFGVNNANFSPTTKLTFWVGASSNANNIQTDLAGTATSPGPGDLPATASDTFYADGTRACTTDAQCGSTTSGMICSGVTAPTCVAGCRGTGGNGCPVGFMCSSTTNAAGTCGIVDADGDTVPDATEVLLGTNPNLADTDGDGLQDNVELSATGNGAGPFSAINTDGDANINARDLDSDNDCRPDQTDAAPRNAALPSAAASSNCGGATPICNTTVGLCVDCVVDVDCGGPTSGQICTANACMAGCRGTGNGCPIGSTCSSVNVSPGTCAPSDTDGDGVPDAVEISLGTNPALQDSDGDTILDNVELSATGGAGPFLAINTDGDLLIDARDTDSDNDCLRDRDDATRRNPALPSANPNGNCSGGTPVCDTTAGLCVPLCTTDSDCGNATSGKICLGSPSACIAGCYGTGGNGCSSGFTCSSTTNAVGTCAPTDTDGDGVSDVAEAAFGTDPTKADTDGDGISDAAELSATGSAGPFAAIDSDVDGVIDAKDADSDNDGIPDATEKGAASPATDSDGDLIANYRDLDSDNDGIPDLWENGGRALDVNGDGRVDVITDADGDGLVAAFDTNDADATVRTTKTAIVNTDGDTEADYLDLDSDGDTLKDIVEAGAADANGDGRVDGFSDADKDGYAAALDPGEGGTFLEPLDADLDGAANFQDADDDGDTLLTKDELGTGGAASPANTDADADPNYLDADDDNDTILTKDEVADSKLAAVANEDVDGDGKKNWLDDDADADTMKDGVEGRPDTNANGKPEYLDAKDSDGDGIPDPVETTVGSDPTNPDTDGDGIKDGEEVGPNVGAPIDTDGDGKIDAIDEDDDGDGILTKDEIADAKAAALSDDVDGDGKKNWLDDDADGDLLKDGTEGRADGDGDGKPEYLDPSTTTTPTGTNPSNPGTQLPPPINDNGILEGGGLACGVSRAGHTHTGAPIGELAMFALGLAALARRRSRR